MKMGGAVIGIIGGTIALIIGVISFFIGDLGAALGLEDAVTRQVLSLALPVLALFGGGISSKNGLLGGIFMLISALGIVWVLDFGFILLITSIPIGLGAILSFLGSGAESA